MAPYYLPTVTMSKMAQWQNKGPETSGLLGAAEEEVGGGEEVGLGQVREVRGGNGEGNGDGKWTCSWVFQPVEKLHW